MKKLFNEYYYDNNRNKRKFNSYKTKNTKYFSTLYKESWQFTY